METKPHANIGAITSLDWRIVKRPYEGKYVVESNLDGMAYAEFETFREAERFIAKQLDKAERMKKDRRRSK